MSGRGPRARQGVRERLWTRQLDPLPEKRVTRVTFEVFPRNLRKKGLHKGLHVTDKRLHIAIGHACQKRLNPAKVRSSLCQRTVMIQEPRSLTLELSLLHESQGSHGLLRWAPGAGFAVPGS